MKNFYWILGFVGCSFMVSCQDNPVLEAVLEASGENRKELEKTIDHFSKDENPEKLQAALFLIENMNGKYWYDGHEKDKFGPLMDTIDSLWQAGEIVNFDYKEYLQVYWDSLQTAVGRPVPARADLYPDYRHIDAGFLIGHIEQAFVARENLPWCQSLPFEDFCEYVLPYRVGTEVPEEWNVALWDKCQVLRDTLPDPDRMGLAQTINDHNAYKMHHSGVFWSYPFDMSVSEYERVRLGSCKHSVFYTAMAMRANGLPVAVDFVPQWAGSNAGHEWNVLLLKDGGFHPFDAVNKGFALDLSFRKVAKVFRKTYAPQEAGLGREDWESLPNEFQDLFRKDVTHEYVSTFDVEVPLSSAEEAGENRLAFIATYNNQDWVPQYWGKARDGKALFENMGSGIVYTAMAYRNGYYQQVSEPFLLDTLGNLLDLKVNEQSQQDMTLTRKYPLTSFMEGIMAFVVGNKIQGANQRDFADSTTFFAINEIPQKIETENVTDKNRYRYVRMWIPEGGRGDMAELEFYGINGPTGDTVKLEGKVIGDPGEDIRDNRFFAYPFDGDLLTYFMKPRQIEPWVGLDLGRPERIVKVRYCPRSDTNFIEVGDTYELFYWKEGDWKSMGRKTAQRQELYYEKVPSGGLYILRNLSKGKEERIFTYKEGKQVWW